MSDFYDSINAKAKSVAAAVSDEAGIPVYFSVERRKNHEVIIWLHCTVLAVIGIGLRYSEKTDDVQVLDARRRHLGFIAAPPEAFRRAAVYLKRIAEAV
jgi:hypothetical protein